MASHSTPHGSRSADAPIGLLLPSAILGIALGGFFDGILLHQVLQWHHLLSLVPGEEYRDPKTQILADGMFHGLMYVLTLAGLWLLWRRRPLLAAPGASRRIVGGAVLGFGLWNIVDVAGFHWLLGIHRIRVDVPDPLAYDLGWLAAFGVLPLAIAWLILRGGGASGGNTAATLAGVMLIACLLAARPPSGDTTLVVFRPGITGGAAINAVLNQGRIIWVSPAADVMAVVFDRPGAALALYERAALLVTRSPILAGCVARTTT